MKKIKNIKMLSLLAVVLATSSCTSFLDVNKDPNRVTGDNVTPDLIFTQAQNAVGVRQATRFIYMDNWMGYFSRSGTFIVEQEETTYKVANTFSEGNWDQAYNILFDLYQVQTRALAINDSVLTGASMVLSAKLWQETVDQFGAIPYSQAFDYVKYPRPVYDKANVIYPDLLVQLDKAITLLNAIVPKASFVNTDLIFARGKDLTGSIAKWKKLANTIKLRIYIRQSEMAGFVPPTTAQMSKMASDGGFFAAGEDVSVNPGYSNSTDKQNPFYAQFGLTPAGAPATTNNKPNNYFVKTILGATDPRLTRFFADPIAGTDYGAQSGNKNAVNGLPVITGSEIGPGLAGSAEQDQFIIPSFESLFLQAEAAQRGWITTSTAQALFESAITESFRWLGVTTTDKSLLKGVALTDSLSNDYIKNEPTAMWANSGTTTASKVKFIAYQKYISLCGIDANESWSDLRRGVLVLPAGYLSNNPNKDARGLPKVLPYPQTELTTNSSSLPTRTADAIFTEKLFWQP